MTRTLRLAMALSCLAGVGCSPTVYGRVVSDVRVANGYISVDRCLLTQRAYHGMALRNCQTENYYIGKSVIPVSATTSDWQRP